MKNMKKEEAEKRLKAIELEVVQLRKIVNEPDSNKTKEQGMSEFLFEMLKETTCKITCEKELTYYSKDGVWLIQQDCKNGKLWVKYSLIWEVFETKFGLKYQQISDFIGGWVETNLGWKGLTPCFGNWY